MSIINKSRPIPQWMQQLSDAVACLESLGYAHDNIKPQNILLDNQDQLKLADFDHAQEALSEAHPRLTSSSELKRQCSPSRAKPGLAE
jgi:serine/threonine protein kinase